MPMPITDVVGRYAQQCLPLMELWSLPCDKLLVRSCDKNLLIKSCNVSLCSVSYVTALLFRLCLVTT
jgi:hypothetical protein